MASHVNTEKLDPGVPVRERDLPRREGVVLTDPPGYETSRDVLVRFSDGEVTRVVRRFLDTRWST